MNMFVPQSIQAQVEIAALADVKKHIISPRFSRPIIKFKQDAAVAAYSMTVSDIMLSYKDVMNIAAYCKSIDLAKIPKKPMSSRELISLIIPECINYKGMTKEKKPIEIKNGKLIEGALNDSVLNMISSTTYDIHGPNRTRLVIDDIQIMMIQLHLMFGQTVGLGDAVSKPEVARQVRELIESKMLEIRHKVTELENHPDMIDQATLEDQLRGLQEKCNGEVIQMMMKSMDHTNGFYSLVISGAKGKNDNIGQISGAVGKQELKTKRIPKKLNNRTMPHFHQNDDSGEARGFIKHSYYDGLTPQEFFFHHSTGREGLIDTAIKSVTGDTPIVIIEDGTPKYVQIGEWIDAQLDANKDAVEHLPEKQQELLATTKITYIPTTDDDGKVTWGEVTAITRHDPGMEIYEIKTAGGRSVKVVESKSLIVWNAELSKFKEVATPDIKVGDCLPVTANLREPHCVDNRTYDEGLAAGKNATSVPHEAFTASTCYIQGFLASFFGTKTCVETTSARVAENIAMLCSRIGVFATLDDTTVAISEDVGMHNDVVLDPIESIEKLDVSKYPKVYDITVPSTLNFGLANGLQVRDTADSGYLQRRLIKGMEDVMVAYDGTVRSSTNTILQPLYGDSHMQLIYNKENPIKLIGFDNAEMVKVFSFTDEECKKVGISKKQNQELLDMLFQFRDDLRVIQRKGKLSYMTVIDKYALPINMIRLLMEGKAMEVSGKEETPSASYIVDKLEEILRADVTRIICAKKDEINDEKHVKHIVQSRAKFLFKIALYEYLAPKRVLFEHKLNKKQFDYICEQIIRGFKKATVNAGEMVGVLSAQCLGESLTQMSVIFSTEVCLKITTKRNTIVKQAKIGEVIDDIIAKNPTRTFKVPNHKDSVETSLEYMDAIYEIGSITPDEKMTWAKISHVSRHPTNGNLLKITTMSGRTVTTTYSHNFVVRTKDGLKMANGNQIEVGTRIPIAKKMPYPSNVHFMTFEDHRFSLDEELGWLLGAYLADGNIANTITITKQEANFIENTNRYAKSVDAKARVTTRPGEFGLTTSTHFSHKPTAKLLETYCGCGSFNKFVGDIAHNANLDFVRALIRGYMDGDGNVTRTKHIIRAGSMSKPLIEGIIRLLAYFGIFASIYTENYATSKEDKQNGTKKTFYCLGIAHKYARRYLEEIGTDDPNMRADIEAVIAFSEGEHKNEIDFIDQVPAVSHLVASAAKKLRMPDASRTYGLAERKGTDIGRRTLTKYLKNLEARVAELGVDEPEELSGIRAALDVDVVWDKIVSMEDIEDPKEYVYDFTVPGTQTFMVNNQIVIHNTLNTFHSAGTGVSGMQGIPRFREIISYTKSISTPFMVIRLTPDVRENAVMAHKIMSHLRYTKLKDIVSKMDIIYDPIATSKFHRDDAIQKKSAMSVGGANVALETQPWLYRATINREAMVEYDMTLLDVNAKFVKFWESAVADSSIKKTPLAKVNSATILSSDENAEQPVVHIRMDIAHLDTKYMVDLCNFLLDKLTLKGTEAIAQIDKLEEQNLVIFNPETGAMETKKEHVIYTKGIDLEKIKRMPKIDFYTTMINDVHLAYKTFGIEAARAVICKQIDIVYNDSGNDINLAHIALLADVMTHTGGITSIDRHGINRLDTDPLSRASFEKTVEQLSNAAAYNETDYLRSVSSRIAIGSVIKGGTGLCDILMDTDSLLRREFVPENVNPNAVIVEANPIIADLAKRKKKVFVPE